MVREGEVSRGSECYSGLPTRADIKRFSRRVCRCWMCPGNPVKVPIDSETRINHCSNRLQPESKCIEEDVHIVVQCYFIFFQDGGFRRHNDSARQNPSHFQNVPGLSTRYEATSRWG